MLDAHQIHTFMRAIVYPNLLAGTASKFVLTGKFGHEMLHLGPGLAQEGNDDVAHLLGSYHTVAWRGNVG
jgi:hypothetical protein